MPNVAVAMEAIECIGLHHILVNELFHVAARSPETLQ